LQWPTLGFKAGVWNILPVIRMRLACLFHMARIRIFAT